MSIERYTGAIPSTGVYQFAGGNFALLTTASAAVNLRTERRGTSEGFNGVSGGLLIRRVEPWENLRVIGTPGVTFEILTGSENIESDETDVRLQIATIAGVASVAMQPSANLSTLAPAVITAGTFAQVAAQNTSRTRITFSADSQNPGSVFLRANGSNNDLFELQPGASITLANTALFNANNPNATSCTVYRLEEF